MYLCYSSTAFLLAVGSSSCPLPQQSGATPFSGISLFSLAYSLLSCVLDIAVFTSCSTSFFALAQPTITIVVVELRRSGAPYSSRFNSRPYDDKNLPSSSLLCSSSCCRWLLFRCLFLHNPSNVNYNLQLFHLPHRPPATEPKLATAATALITRWWQRTTKGHTTRLSRKPRTMPRPKITHH